MRSDLAHLLGVRAMEMPHDSVNKLSQFIGGMKHTVVKESNDAGKG